jgi:hypothetical protein
LTSFLQGAAMSDATPGGFGKFVPGFDFLQNLAKGTAAGMPGMAHWVAPTMEPKEIDKRIEELKSVLFWLDQNATALKATIQALELQKMTLATLKSMNLDMSSMAQAFKFPASATPSAATPSAAKPASPQAPDNPDPVSTPKASRKRGSAKPGSKAQSSKASLGVVDPMQLWGALTQQFGEIAAGAMKEVSAQVAQVAGSPGLAAKAPASKTAAPRASIAKAAKTPRAKSARATATVRKR